MNAPWMSRCVTHWVMVYKVFGTDTGEEMLYEQNHCGLYQQPDIAYVYLGYIGLGSF